MFIPGFQIVASVNFYIEAPFTFANQSFFQKVHLIIVHTPRHSQRPCSFYCKLRSIVLLKYVEEVTLKRDNMT